MDCFHVEESETCPAAGNHLPRERPSFVGEDPTCGRGPAIDMGGYPKRDFPRRRPGYPLGPIVGGEKELPPSTALGWGSMASSHRSPLLWLEDVFLLGISHDFHYGAESAVKLEKPEGGICP